MERENKEKEDESFIIEDNMIKTMFKTGDKLAKAINDACKLIGMNRSEFIRYCIKKHLFLEGEEQKKEIERLKIIENRLGLHDDNKAKAVISFTITKSELTNIEIIAMNNNISRSELIRKSVIMELIEMKLIDKRWIEKRKEEMDDKKEKTENIFRPTNNETHNTDKEETVIKDYDHGMSTGKIEIRKTPERQRVTIVMDTDLIKMVEYMALKNNINRSEFMRKAIEEAVKREMKEGETPPARIFKIKL